MLTMIVGTYTGGSSVGIYTYRFHAEALTVQPLDKAVIDNPSYLAVSPDNAFVYAVSESNGNATVNAFTFDQSTGTLRFLNNKPVDAGPCYILYHEATKTVITANYSGGSVSITPIAADGSLTDTPLTIRYEGQGVHPSRQTKPYLHCIAASSDNTVLFATDLGTDKVHKIDILQPLKESIDLSSVFKKSTAFEVEPGSGPRHFIFNKKNTMAYLINELSGMVTVFSVDKINNLTVKQYILADTVQAGGSADIRLTPDEKFLYASTRLKGDGIAIFRVNDDGLLTKVGFQATGIHPRNFAITPDGNLLLVACRDSGIIQIFKIDKRTGLLTDTGQTISVDRPVCILIIPKG